ncbi:MAG TPA: hypothetical protein VGK77_18475 [Candidatus Binatia bacterium]
MADHRPKNQAESINITSHFARVGFFSVIPADAGGLCRHPVKTGVQPHNLDTVFQRYDERCPSPGCRLEFILSAIEGRYDILPCGRSAAQ